MDYNLFLHGWGLVIALAILLTLVLAIYLVYNHQPARLPWYRRFWLTTRIPFWIFFWIAALVGTYVIVSQFNLKVGEGIPKQGQLPPAPSTHNIPPASNESGVGYGSMHYCGVVIDNSNHPEIVFSELAQDEKTVIKSWTIKANDGQAVLGVDSPVTGWILSAEGHKHRLIFSGQKLWYSWNTTTDAVVPEN